MSGSPLEKYGDGVYEDLFVTALRNHGMLSIGLYRWWPVWYNMIIIVLYCVVGTWTCVRILVLQYLAMSSQTLPMILIFTPLIRCLSSCLTVLDIIPWCSDICPRNSFSWRHWSKENFTCEKLFILLSFIGRYHTNWLYRMKMKKLMWSAIIFFSNWCLVKSLLGQKSK